MGNLAESFLKRWDCELGESDKQDESLTLASRRQQFSIWLPLWPNTCRSAQCFAALTVPQTNKHGQFSVVCIDSSQFTILISTVDAYACGALRPISHQYTYSILRGLTAPPLRTTSLQSVHIPQDFRGSSKSQHSRLSPVLR
jgi:hypothetical protein